MCKIIEDDREVVLDCFQTMRVGELLLHYDETYKNSSYGVGQALRYRLYPQFISCGHECGADEFSTS